MAKQINIPLESELKYPKLSSFKNKPRHGHFNCHSSEEDRVVLSIWCHSTYENVFYYTSSAFSDPTYLGLLTIANDKVFYKVSSTQDKFKEDKDEDAAELLQELRRIRLSYLLDKELSKG